MGRTMRFTGAGELLRYVVLATIFLVIVAAATEAVADPLITIDRMRPGELEMTGFELTKDADVRIEAVGARTRYSDNLVVYAWILNHETRQPVWVMKGSRTDGFSGSKLLRQADKVEFLEKGKYELYMYAARDWGFTGDISGAKDFFGFLEDLFEEDDFDDRSYRDILRDCFVSLHSNELQADQVKEFSITGDIPGTLVKFNRAEDDEYIRQEFRLDKPMNIHVYSLIEYPRGWDNPVDYGWIVNAETREKVWEMDRFNTERAGGGKKNRKFDDEVRLDAGRYVLHYTTDDSHSYEGFNVAPPYDPINWGVTLLPGKDFDASAFSLVELSEMPDPVVDFTRARDYDYFEQAIELKKPTSLYLRVLGEYSEGDRAFVDYGWIEDANTGETVWEMTKRNTEHAGGGDKNRMFDGYINLDAGKYVVYYITDDSHSYRDWNTSRPYQPDAWGLALFAGTEADVDNIGLIDSDALYANSDLLARLTRVRDREQRRGTFSLDKSTRVHVYAIGEYSSRDRQFVDYAWIEDADNGRTVWEMTRRNTEHAGGADKNRMYDDTILLDKGEYRVHYISDGSHSFADWNASRPDDPINWGVTVRVASERTAGR